MYTTQFDRAKELLLQLNRYLDGTYPHILVQNLRGKDIFPIRTVDGTATMVKLDDVWYFADRLNLQKSFDGRLPLLAFDVKTIRILQPLIISLEQTAGLLYTADRPKLERVGIPIYDEQKSIYLRKRAVQSLFLLMSVFH